MSANEPNVPHHYDRRPGDYPRRQTPRYGWRDDDGKPIHAIAADGTPICGRRCNTTGTPCQKSGPFLCANGRCNAIGHGGTSPGGPLKHGRYSMYLPTRLAATYERVSQDDVLNNVNENIRILVALIQQRLAEMGEDSSAELWKDAQITFDALMAAVFNRDDTALFISLDKMKGVLKNGAGIQQMQKEVADMMTKAAAMTRVELARLEKLGQFMTAQEMMANQAYILSIIKEHAPPESFEAIAEKISKAAYDVYG